MKISINIAPVIEKVKIFASRVLNFFKTNAKKIGLISASVVIVLLAGWFVIPAPSAQGSMRGHMVEIYRNAEIRVIFDQPMNHGSVEESFSIRPAVTGQFSWQGNQLTFKPSPDLEKGVDYDVVIDQSAKSIFFKPLGETYNQTFRVLNYPEVVVNAPVNESTIMQDQRLTVLFDHPIRKLTRETHAPKLLNIEPAVEGDYLWLGTTGFEFVPKNGWTASTVFNVTVPKGTKMADGGETIQDFSWHFQTENLTAYTATDVRQKPKQNVRLSFNYPVDAGVVAKALVITEKVNGVADQQLSIDQFTVSNDPKDPNAVLLMKKGFYELGKTYEMKLPQGFTADLGPLGLTSEFVANIVMDEKGFKLLSTDPVENTENCVSCNFVLTFNNQVDQASAIKNITFSPKVENISMDAYDDQTHQLNISGNWKASTSYTVKLGAGLMDIYGQKIEKPLSLILKKGPYDPRVDLADTYNQYGVLAANLPRVYQLRAINVDADIPVSLCSGTFEQYVKQQQYDCQIKADKVFNTKGTLNDYKVIDIDLDQMAGKSLPLGAYQLNMQLPKLPSMYTDTNITKNILIVDTALTIKYDQTGKFLVWATDLVSGQPVAGLDVELWRSQNNDPSEKINNVSKKTDQNGLAIIEVGEINMSDEFAVKASSQEHLGFSRSSWNDGIDTWNYGLNSSYSRGAKNIGYIYTDRKIYRPDQLVYFKGIVRLDTDARLSIPKEKESRVTITDTNGAEIYNQNLKLSSFGSFNGEFQLNSAMPLGAYTIQSYFNDTTEINGTFTVNEYRRPDFKVESTMPAGTLLAGQEIKIPVHAEYYQGVPLSKATASYSVTRTKLFFQPLPNEWYSFSDDDGSDDCWWYCRPEGNYESLISGDVTLDDNGNAVITVPANLSDYKFSANYTVNVTVTDVNQRTVSNSLDFPVHKGEFYFGIRSNYSSGWDSANADFDLISLNTDGTIKPSVSATVKLFKRVWNNIQKTNADGSTSWEYQKTDTLIESKDITTGTDGKTQIRFTPVDNGEFIALVESHDSRGNLISASTNRYIYRGSYSGVRISDDHQMRIIQSKASYEVGETASLAVQTPYAATKALVTVERDSIISYKVVDLGSDKRLVDIPITEGGTPNIYVSVMTVQGGGAKGVPEFRLGYADLQVNTTKKILNLNVTPDKSTYKPGEKVTLNVEARLPDGNPAQAEVSIAVVDERVVSLLGSIDKNILGKFWFDRNIGVRTAQTLTKLVKKIFYATEGGAGGKGDDGSTSAVRGNFKDTAYWNATLETGADGLGTITFILPDNLTSWQILSIGATKDTVVGSAESKIVTRRDLMVEPLLPRILRKNDRAQIGATVINATKNSINATISLDVDGLIITDSKVKQVTVPALGRTPIYWQVSAPEVNPKARIKVYAKGGDLEDGFEVYLPILTYAVPEMVTASGILEKNATETIELPTDILKNTGDLKISVQPNVGNGLQGGMDYLVNYPYGCSEQKTSNLIANLLFTQLTALKITAQDPAKEQEAKNNATQAINDLIQLQRFDGGFGFWQGSEDSYPHLTAYVLWGLMQAQQAGLSVDSGVLDKADNYLRDSLKNPKSTDFYWDSEKAEVVFILSVRNSSGLNGYASTLYDRSKNLSSFAKIFLAMAYANIESPTSARTKKLMGDLKNKLVYLNPSTAYINEDAGYDWFFSSNLRSTGLYLKALMMMDPHNQDVERLVRYIVEQKKDGYWGTTQDTAISLLALIDYVKANPINEQSSDVDIFLNNKLVNTLNFPKGDVSGQASYTIPVPQLLAKGNTHQVGLEKASDTRYFYDMTLKTYREIENIEPFDNGFTIVSDIYGMNDKKSENPLSSLKVGERARVKMRLLVPKKHQYVSMEYHLPAGLEAIDFSLNTSPKELAGVAKQCSPDWWGGENCFSENSMDWQWWWANVWKHIEYRDDRVFLFTEHLDPGVYQYEFIVQALTPGEYRIPPARVYEFYNPDSNAHNEGKIFTVTK